MKQTLLILGVAGGGLMTLLRWSEYQFLVVQHSTQVYGALTAVIFAAFGIWLGHRLSSPHPPAPATATPATPSLAPNTNAREHLGITRRELECLGLVAQGMSNREIAGRLCVSENTVKTHCSRAFDKIGARRRTEAVQMGKQLGLLP